MPDFDPNAPILSAFREASRRGIMPTSLDTAGLRELSAEVRRNSVFSARTTHAGYLSRVKGIVDAILAGDMDIAEGRLILKQTLNAIGYAPEGGFGAMDEGKVPPAVAGSIRDLGSDRRLNLLLSTQVGLMRGAAQKVRGHDAGAVRQFPAWELIRVADRAAPRDWAARWTLALANLDRTSGLVTDADGQVRLVAPKGDAIWKALGSSDLFDDALDVDHPPFAFESGMGWREVRRAEAVELGIMPMRNVTPPNVVEIRPSNVIDMLPRPKASTAGIAPDLLAMLKADLAAEEATQGVLTLTGRETP